MGIGETVGAAAVMAYRGFGLWMPSLARVTIGCRRTAATGGGVDEAVPPEEDEVEEGGGVASNRGADGVGDVAVDGAVDVRSSEDDVEEDVGVSSNRGAVWIEDGGAVVVSELCVPSEMMRRLGRRASPRPAVVWGATIWSTSRMTTVDGSRGWLAWRKGNWSSSKTTCRDVITRCVATS